MRNGAAGRPAPAAMPRCCASASSYACKRLGFRHRGNVAKLDTTLFRKPARQSEQLSLL